jgi:5-methylcytosine-specific restriction endonuclease McrA
MGWSYPSPPGWTTTRTRILRRDRGICHVCHQPGADQVDHITPRAEGGDDSDSNLAAVHAHPCHAAKTANEQRRGKARRARRRPQRRNPNLLT